LTSGLLLDFAGAFDEVADEDFGVAVDGGDDGRGDGLREGLVCDLDSVLDIAIFERQLDERGPDLSNSFLSQLDTPKHVVTISLLAIEGTDKDPIPISHLAQSQRIGFTYANFSRSFALSILSPSSIIPPVAPSSSSSSSSSSPSFTLAPSLPLLLAVLITLPSAFFLLPLFPFAPVPPVTVLRPPVRPVMSLSILGLRAPPVSRADSSGGKEVCRRGCEPLGVETAEGKVDFRRFEEGWLEVRDKEGRFLGLGRDAGCG